jgi:hypothetical protein
MQDVCMLVIRQQQFYNLDFTIRVGKSLATTWWNSYFFILEF